jgi:hypothetical protein
MWFAWRDVPPERPVCRWCHTAGLIDADGSPKPSWTEYTELSAGRVGSEDGGRDADPVVVAVLAVLAVVGAAGTLLVRRHRPGR